MNLPEKQQQNKNNQEQSQFWGKINHIKKKTTNGIAPKQHAAKITKRYHL